MNQDDTRQCTARAGSIKYTFVARHIGSAVKQRRFARTRVRENGSLELSSARKAQAAQHTGTGFWLADRVGEEIRAAINTVSKLLNRRGFLLGGQGPNRGTLGTPQSLRRSQRPPGFEQLEEVNACSPAQWHRVVSRQFSMRHSSKSSNDTAHVSIMCSAIACT